MKKSLEVAFVSVDAERFNLWDKAFDGRAHLHHVGSGGQMLAYAADNTPALAIIDAQLPDMAGLDLARRLVMVNAMINVALVSDAPAEAFHDVTEGLGILAQLPEVPEQETVPQLLADLAGVTGLV